MDLNIVEKVFGYIDRLFKVGEDNSQWLVAFLGLAIISRMLKVKLNLGGDK